MTNMALVIDGDIFLWESCLASEYSCHWGDDLWTLHSDAKEARQRLDTAFANLKEKLQGETMKVALTGDENWRKEVLPTYKANRKKTRKPVVFHDLKCYVRDTYPTVEIPTLEADDICGMLMGPKLWRSKYDKILISTDKDLKQIPGYHYNPGKPEEGISEVSEEDGYYNFMFQTLTGDAVDGYSGCPKVGPKTAQRILAQAVPSDYWALVLEAYEGVGLTEEDALQQARVARIMREGDYNHKTNEVKLWAPPPPVE